MSGQAPEDDCGAPADAAPSSLDQAATSTNGQLPAKATGLSKDFTLHGLGKSPSKLLAEGGASTRELMDVLGHADIDNAELYSRATGQA